MASKKEKLRDLLTRQLAIAKPAVIDPALAGSLRASLAPVSEPMFRSLLRECGVPLAPEVEGVRQDDPAHLERTLLALAQEYASADADSQRRLRSLVIRAKDHARLAARNPGTTADLRAQKEEMILWMLTWLENPPIFEAWVALRKNVLTATRWNLP